MNDLADPTGKPQQKQKRVPGRPFVKGQSGNPAGRPFGCRNRFSREFIEDFFKAWVAHGGAALNTMAQEEPARFVEAGIKLLPRHLEVDEESAVDFLRVWRLLGQQKDNPPNDDQT